MGIRREQRWVVFIVSIFLFLVLISAPATAVDELYLIGFVQSVDVRSGIVVVDVKSQSCSGPRRFRTDDPSSLKELEGRKISFALDSSVCSSDRIHKITVISVLLEERTR